MKLHTSLLLLLTLTSARAAIQTSGSILIDMRASGFSTGATTWTNVSAPAGSFVSSGTPRRETVDGAACVVFDGSDSFASPGNPPAILCGNNPVSIEAWVWNGNLRADEPVMAWGTFGTAQRTARALQYGTGAAAGAVSHNGGAELGWGAGAAPPEAGAWHHLVYTYGSNAVRCYADGTLCSSFTSTLPLAVATTQPMRLCKKDVAGNVVVSSMALGQVRVHTGALTAAQVENNFREELPAYSGGTAPALAAKKCARLSATMDFPPGPVSGAPPIREDHDEMGLLTSIKVASTPGQGTGTGVHLPGGSSATAPYFSFPGSGVSGRMAITIEFWATILNAPPGSCLLAIGGTSSALAITAPGGNFTPNPAAGRALTMPICLNGSCRESSISTTGGVVERTSAAPALGRMVHYVITWDATGGEWRRYEDARLVDSIADPDGTMGLITDNCWIGRSLNSADPNPDIILEEFRLHDYALSQAEIMLSDRLGPDVLVFPGVESTFAHWSAARGISANANGDHDGNGVSNLVQFATDSDRDGQPNFSHRRSGAYTAPDYDDDPSLTVPVEVTGVTYTLEESPSLTGFGPSALTLDPAPRVSEDGRSRVLRWYSIAPLPSRMFRRVTVGPSP